LVNGNRWSLGMESYIGERFYHPDGMTKFLQVVLPPVLRRPFVEKLQAELGHFGRSKTALAVSKRAYFPAWRSFTHLVVKNCSVCNRLQRSKQPQKQTKLRPMTEFCPMAVLHADLVGPIPPGRNSLGQRGFQYILSVVDSATHYLWLLPLRHKTADEVAAVLCEQVILRVSCLSAIITDQGKEFTGAVVQAVCDTLGITRLRTSGYHPQTDSKAERVHFSVHNMITKLLDKVNPSLWVDALGPAAFAYNSTVHSTTGFCPYELFYSRPSCLLDVLVETLDEDAVEMADEYALSVAERMREAFKFMREFSSKQTERMPSNYDASIKPKSFEPDSCVLLYVPKVPKGTYSKWAIFYQGPYKVIRKLNSHNYVVRKMPKSKDLVVHCDRLRPYFPGLQGTPWQKHESAKVHSEKSDHVGTDTNVDNSDLTSMHMHEQVGTNVTGHEDGQQPITAAAKLSRPRRQARRPARFCHWLGVCRIHCLLSGNEEDGRHCSSELSDYYGSKTIVDMECDSIAPRVQLIECRRDHGSNYRRRSVTMSKRAGASNSSSDSDAGGHDENGHDGRACRFTDPAGPSGPPLDVGEVGDAVLNLLVKMSRHLVTGPAVVVLRDARHLIDDAGTASASASTSSDDRYRLHARGAASTSSVTDRYRYDARGDRYRDRGDTDLYLPGTGRAPPLRGKQLSCADRHSPGDDRASTVDKPEVTDQQRRRRRRGGLAFSPRPSRRCGGGSVFKTSSGLRRHAATERHMYFWRPDAYVPIPPNKLDAVLRSIRQGQVHQRPKKSAGSKKKKVQVRQVWFAARTTSPAWVPDDTRASPPAAAASAAAGRPPTPSFPLQEDEGVFFTGQGEDLELPELFQSGRLTPTKFCSMTSM